MFPVLLAYHVMFVGVAPQLIRLVDMVWQVNVPTIPLSEFGPYHILALPPPPQWGVEIIGGAHGSAIPGLILLLGTMSQSDGGLIWVADCQRSKAGGTQ